MKKQRRKFININKVYRVPNSVLGLDSKGRHNVVVVWKNGEKQIARVKTISSMEHPLIIGGRRYMVYDYKKLELAKKGGITPYPIKELGTKRWSGIFKKSHVVSYKYLYEAPKGLKKPKDLIKK